MLINPRMWVYKIVDRECEGVHSRSSFAPLPRRLRAVGAVTASGDADDASGRNQAITDIAPAPRNEPVVLADVIGVALEQHTGEPAVRVVHVDMQLTNRMRLRRSGRNEGDCCEGCSRQKPVQNRFHRISPFRLKRWEFYTLK